MSDFENLVMELRESVDEGHSKCEGLEIEVKTANQDVKDKAAEISDFKKKLASTEKDLREAKEGIKKLDKTVTEHERDVRKKVELIDNLEIELAEIKRDSQREQEKLTKKFDEAKSKVDTLTADIKALKATEKAKDKEIDGLWTKMSDFDTLVLELRGSLEESILSHDSLQKDLKCAREESKEKTSKVTELTKQVDSTHAELARKVNVITTLEKEKAKSIAEFKTLKRDKDSLLHDINTKIAQFERDIADNQHSMAREVDTAAKKLEDSKAKIERLEKDLKSSKAAEKAKDKEVDEAWKKMSDFEKMVMELREAASTST
mmetsp:Transcript_73014/g.107113  ORF Transcript_73014/g.107113 Transcript_73014/m.107113 type:complete len:319 (+) Transcript_73014:850-1806(+)